MCFSHEGLSELARPTKEHTHARTHAQRSAAVAASSKPVFNAAPLAQIEVTIRRLGSGCSPALNEWNTHVWRIQPTPGSLHCIVGMHCVALLPSVSAMASFHDGGILMLRLGGVIPERRGQTGNAHTHSSHARKHGSAPSHWEGRVTIDIRLSKSGELVTTDDKFQRRTRSLVSADVWMSLVNKLVDY